MLITQVLLNQAVKKRCQTVLDIVIFGSHLEPLFSLE